MSEKDKEIKEEKEMQPQREHKEAPQQNLPLDLGKGTSFRGPQSQVEVVFKKDMPIINENEVKLVEEKPGKKNGQPKSEESADKKHEMSEAGVQDVAPPVVSEHMPPPLPDPEKIKEKIDAVESEKKTPKSLPERPEITAETVIDGTLLKRVRESMGFSIEAVKQRTKISKIWIEMIEADKYEELPSLVYIRGYITSLAKMYNLPVEQTVNTYLLQIKTFLEK